MLKTSVLFFILLFCQKAAQALPLYYQITKNSELNGQVFTNLLAVSLNKESNIVSRINMEKDEIEANSFLVLRSPGFTTPKRDKVDRPEKSDPFAGKLTKFHRLVFDDASLTKCNATCEQSAAKNLGKFCADFGGYEQLVQTLEDKGTGGIIYLLRCKKNTNQAHKNTITFNYPDKTISTPFYKTSLTDDNPFLLKSLYFIDSKSNTNIGNKFDFSAFFKSKFFLNFNFTTSDLAGEIVSSSINSLATSLEITTNSTIAGVKINQQVCCDITFYKDAFYLPINMQIPDFIGTLKEDSFASLKFNSELKAVPQKTPANIPYILLESTDKYAAIVVAPLGFRNFTPASENSTQIIATKSGEFAINLNLTGSQKTQQLELWVLLEKSQSKLIQRINAGLHLEDHTMTN